MAQNALSELTAVSPLDGRYRKHLEKLSEYTSEFALIKTRIEVEVEYFKALSESEVVRKITNQEEEILEGIVDGFDVVEAEKVKKLEDEIKHDVKAMEVYVRQELEDTTLKDTVEFIHFGLTSEDINNISYRLILKRALDRVILPAIMELHQGIHIRSREHKDLAILARTHGQPAVPTTLGKEFAVIANRLKKQIDKLEEATLTGKLNGAVGNFNALAFAYDDVDWPAFSKKFIKSLGLEPNMLTTQINPPEDLIEVFQILIRINGIVSDFDQDMWLYISDGWFVQEAREKEAGSSVMPQKINPIFFENSQGNIQSANDLLTGLSLTLPISRLQRDLIDSTRLRNISTVLGYSLIGYKNATEGLSRCRANREEIEKALDSDWTILAEAVQTFLRAKGVGDPYNLIKSHVRGKHMGEAEWKELVENLPVDAEDQKKLLTLTPSNYTGLVSELIDP